MEMQPNHVQHLKESCQIIFVKLINCRKYQFLTDVLYYRCSSEKRVVLSRNLPHVGFLWAFFYRVDLCISSIFILSFFLKQGEV